MPAPIIDKLKNDSGKSESEVEKAWDKAKEITADTFDKKESDFGDKEWSYVTGTAKNILGIKESQNKFNFDLQAFLKSNLNAKKFIEETMISSSLGAINQAIIKPNQVEVIDMTKGLDKLDKPKEDGLISNDLLDDEKKKKEVKESKADDIYKEYLAAGIVLQYINARHAGNIKQADQYKSELKKLLGSDFEKFTMKFGNPDIGNWTGSDHMSTGFNKVQQAWIDEISRLQRVGTEEYNKGKK